MAKKKKIKVKITEAYEKGNLIYVVAECERETIRTTFPFETTKEQIKNALWNTCFKFKPRPDLVEEWEEEEEE